MFGLATCCWAIWNPINIIFSACWGGGGRRPAVQLSGRADAWRPSTNKLDAMERVPIYSSTSVSFTRMLMATGIHKQNSPEILQFIYSQRKLITHVHPIRTT
jgi:hypothetical protein